MIPEQQAKIQQSIALLQQVLGQVSLNPSSQQGHQTQVSNQANPFPEFEKQLKIF
jgi:hypothetical protein